MPHFYKKEEDDILSNEGEDEEKNDDDCHAKRSKLAFYTGPNFYTPEL